MQFDICVFWENLWRKFNFIKIWHEQRVFYMKTNIKLLSHSAQFFLEWEMFQREFVDEIKTHISYLIILFFENRAIYEIMWKNVVHPGRPQMALRRKHIACWVTYARNIHSEYIMLNVFPLQQWLHERTSVLHYTSCLGFSYNAEYCFL